jgi:hypothetical protein
MGFGVNLRLIAAEKRSKILDDNIMIQLLKLLYLSLS